ncbi:AI-2E family transporter [Oceanicoccus sagamiensis]|uniref:AI-2E family transporter n=1 Tax=Oceanicoccus sagamiensis TaxID=716816 RepID=UPI000A26E9FC|nr:AI-2E family transporter [Oceanicoccus sagamiensis]
MEQNNFQKEVIQAAISVGLLIFILYVSLQIVKPFIVLVLWAGIIATALYPLHKSLTARLGDNKKRSSVLITLVGLAILIIPVSLLTDSLIDTTQTISDKLAEGDLKIPRLPTVSHSGRLSVRRSMQAGVLFLQILRVFCRKINYS